VNPDEVSVGLSGNPRVSYSLCKSSTMMSFEGIFIQSQLSMISKDMILFLCQEVWHNGVNG
jgi:hypothetical protein